MTSTSFRLKKQPIRPGGSSAMDVISQIFTSDSFFGLVHSKVGLQCKPT